ncbi:PCYCGC motif-containing (lipo)protein [Exiguobacterium antarcticum]|uniref:PCYCGC motif-containing (lipo)protein n=1 Tax=Exiguobacterium antarcticum TaxID=132920 RepID=UPI000285EC39|nr:PCYCGC motif-containing (lipo)protein [Exiguobacterium antarcticum]AFS71650.1 Hypothetical protein Eab7_2561 [Exiguobacterium antarcticum B7]
MAMPRKTGWMIVTLSASLALAACGQAEQKTASHTDHAKHTTHAGTDQLEQTSSPTLAPSFLKETDSSTQTIYLSVAKHQDLLEKSYCGCGESAGHTSNYDCFIADQTTDFDDTRDYVRISPPNRLLLTNKALRSKKSDAAYAKTGAKPTPTPAL